MVVSLACLAVARAEGALAGSLPSWPATAWVSTPPGGRGGSLLRRWLRLVRERGRLMQEASERVPGAMAAVMGLPEEKVADSARRLAPSSANLNSPGQAVIGGPLQAVERALELARARAPATWPDST